MVSNWQASSLAHKKRLTSFSQLHCMVSPLSIMLHPCCSISQLDVALEEGDAERMLSFLLNSSPYQEPEPVRVLLAKINKETFKVNVKLSTADCFVLSWS